VAGGVVGEEGGSAIDDIGVMGHGVVGGCCGAMSGVVGGRR
jgi:hypothetical protein